MYNNYYVNKLTTGNPNYNHEVHKDTCPFLPSISNRDYLGIFQSSREAIEAAKKLYNNVDGCAICCPESHSE